MTKKELKEMYAEETPLELSGIPETDCEPCPRCKHKKCFASDCGYLPKALNWCSRCGYLIGDINELADGITKGLETKVFVTSE